LIRILLITLFLLITLNARENPFFPTEGEIDIPLTSTTDNSMPALKRATITLPSQARTLQKVTVEFKNLDGSIESKSIELQNAIDWHLPIFISQSFSAVHENIEPKIEKKKEADFKTIASVKHATFLSSDKTLKIVTQDKMIRNFLLAEPHRIVIDFKRDTSLKSYTKKIAKNIFSVIRVGNHSGYYRVVVELDGLYRYKMQKVPEGYLFSVR
jgi:hypothetical protein